MPITINNVIVPSTELPIKGTGSQADPFAIEDNSITPEKLQDTGVTAGSYENPFITVNEKGQITSVSNNPLAINTIFWVTLDAAGETIMKVMYSGNNPPVLTKVTSGTFKLTVPQDTVLLSANWQANNTNTSSGSIILIIESADGDEYYAAIDILNLANNDIANLSALGIVIDQTLTTAGQVTITMPSVNGFGVSGFKALMRF